MTATITFTAEEHVINLGPMKYEIILRDDKGNARHTAQGPDRAHCLMGLRAFGFTIQE